MTNKGETGSRLDRLGTRINKHSLNILKSIKAIIYMQ